LDHRVALHAGGELVVRPFPRGAAELFILLDGLDRLTGGDPADQLQARGRGARRVVEELDRARHVRLAMDQPLLLEGLQVAHHAVGALDLELEADLANRRPVTPPLDLAANEAVNLALSRRQHVEVGHVRCSEDGGTPVSRPMTALRTDDHQLTLWLLMYTGRLAHA